MYISFSRPLMQAWARAGRMLFRAGDWPERWFVTGFAAFLAGMVSYSLLAGAGFHLAESAIRLGRQTRSDSLSVPSLIS